MPKRVITVELEKVIRKMGKQNMSAAEIARELGLKYHTVHSFLNEGGHVRKLAKTTRQRTVDRRRPTGNMFNVNTRENWLV